MWGISAWFTTYRIVLFINTHMYKWVQSWGQEGPSVGGEGVDEAGAAAAVGGAGVGGDAAGGCDVRLVWLQSSGREWEAGNQPVTVQLPRSAAVRIERNEKERLEE